MKKFDLSGGYGDIYISATHQAGHLRSVHFGICKLYLSEKYWYKPFIKQRKNHNGGENDIFVYLKM